MSLTRNMQEILLEIYGDYCWKYIGNTAGNKLIPWTSLWLFSMNFAINFSQEISPKNFAMKFCHEVFPWTSPWIFTMHFCHWFFHELCYEFLPWTSPWISIMNFAMNYNNWFFHELSHERFCCNFPMKYFYMVFYTNFYITVFMNFFHEHFQWTYSMN